MHPLKPSCVVWINHDNMTDRCFVQITLCTKNLWLHQLKQNYTVIDRYVSCYPLGKNDVIFLETLVSVSDLFLTSIAFAAIKLRSILLCTDGLHWRCEINRAWANPAIIKDSYILVKRCSNSIFAEQNWKIFLVLSSCASLLFSILKLIRDRGFVPNSTGSRSFKRAAWNNLVSFDFGYKILHF